MEVEKPQTSIKAEKIKLQIEHLQTKYDLECRLRLAKFEVDMKKLQLALNQLESM